MEKTALTTIVGTPSEQAWSQAQFFVTESGFSVGLVVCLSQETESDVLDLSGLGASMLATLRESFEATTSTAGLAQIIDQSIDGVASGVEVGIAVCLIGEGELIMLARGEITAYLKRGEALIKLGEGESLSGGISGKLQDGDVLCMASSVMIELIGETKLGEILAEGLASAEVIAPIIHRETDSSKVAGVFASYGLKTEMVGIKSESVLPEMIEKLRNAFRRPLRVKREVEEPRKINRVVAIAALLFLVVMIGFGYVRRARVVAEQEYQSVVTQVEQSLTEAKSIADLNPDRARNLLTQAASIAQAYRGKVTKEPYNTNAAKLVEQISETEKNIFRVDTVNLKPVIELEVLQSGLKANRLYLDLSGNLVFANTAKPEIVGMSIADKSMFKIDTSEVGMVVGLGFFDKTYFGVTDKGIASLERDKKEAKIVIESDPLWGSIDQVHSYAGNLYLFDRGNSEIWKYPVIKDGYGERRRWLGAGITLDLSKVADMKVTGDVWIVTQSGKLERYSRGVPVEFSMEGFPAVAESRRLLDPVVVYVTEDEVYVLERGAKRVVVFSQDGKYKAQYVNEEFGKASDLVVYKSRGYVLIDNVVKEFGL